MTTPLSLSLVVPGSLSHRLPNLLQPVRRESHHLQYNGAPASYRCYNARVRCPGYHNNTLPLSKASHELEKRAAYALSDYRCAVFF